jgi:FkbM family methyltransferase
VILDCGANTGLASLYFATCSPQARIVAFEPDPALYQIFYGNLTRNHLVGRVEAVNAALWAGEAQTVSFASDGADAGHVESGGTGSIHVPAARLSHYLTQPVGLLKMDIEGAELDVLRDSSDLLSNVQQIVLEHHSYTGQPQRLGELMAVLEGAGFRLQINNAHHWINPLVHVPQIDRFDQLLMVYGYRP